MMKTKFQQGIDISKFQGTIKNLKIGGSNDVEILRNVHKQIANNNVFKRGIGIAQKVPRVLQWLQNNTKKDENGQRVLLEHKDADGNPTGQWKIVMNYDSDNFLHNLIVETQAVIDAANAVDGKLYSTQDEWNTNILFEGEVDILSLIHI